jgi:K+-sensing histidine kinase KdpD
MDVTAHANAERAPGVFRRSVSAPHGVLSALALIALSALLTDAFYRASGDHTSLFFLTAAVIVTWAWGPGCGALVVAAGSVFTFHLPLDPPARWEFDEGVAWARFAIFAILAIGFIALVYEVRATSRAVARHAKKLETVLELTPVGIAILDGAEAGSTAARVNPALADILGTRERTAVERDGDDYGFRAAGRPVPEEALPMHVAAASRRPSDRLALDLEREGRTIHLMAQAAPLLEDDGHVQGVVATYVDVTEEREREAQLVRANHAKDEFLGMVSHELKTPLTIISGNAEVLLRVLRNPGDDIRNALLDISAACRQLLHNVENLLAISRLGDGLLQLESVALRPLIARVIDQHRRFAPAISLQCPDVVALAVPAAVERVMDNLLFNAQKYGPPDALIEVAVDAVDGELKVVVADRGFGLLGGEVEAMFEPFYRSPRTSAATGGMGLGLSVCKRMVNSMGGRMWARNREAGGSEFGFSLLRAGHDDANGE